MGVCWWIYCWNHREDLSVEKFWFGPDVGQAPPNLVQEIRQELEKRHQERGPNERKRDERYLALVHGFVERHDGCEVKICCDADEECGRLFEELYERKPEGWWTFCIEHDILMNEYGDLAAVESNRRSVARYQTQVNKIQEKLKKPRIIPLRHWWLRRELSEWQRHLSTVRESLRESEEYLAGDKSEDEDRGKKAIEKEEKRVEEIRAELRDLEEAMKRPGIKPRELRKLEKEYELQKSVLRGVEEILKSMLAYMSTYKSVDLLELFRTKPLGKGFQE